MSSYYEQTRECKMYMALIEYITRFYQNGRLDLPMAILEYVSCGSLFLDETILDPSLREILRMGGYEIPKVAEWFLAGWRLRCGDGNVEHLMLPTIQGNEKDSCLIRQVYELISKECYREDQSLKESRHQARVTFTNGKHFPLEFYWKQYHSPSHSYWGDTREEIVDYIFVRRVDFYRILQGVYNVEPVTFQSISRFIVNQLGWALSNGVEHGRIFPPVMRSIKQRLVGEYYLKRRIGPRHHLGDRIVRNILGML